MAVNHPILWQSTLQYLSLMKADIIALAHFCYKLFLMMNGVIIIYKAIGNPIINTTIHVLIHKDNSGAFVLTEILPS